MSLCARKGTKAAFSLPLHSKDGASSQYSLIKKKNRPLFNSSQTTCPWRRDLSVWDVSTKHWIEFIIITAELLKGAVLCSHVRAERDVSCYFQPVSSVSFNVAFPDAVQLFHLFFFAFARLRLWKQRQSWREVCVENLLCCRVPESYLGISLNWKRTLRPSDRPVPSRLCPHKRSALVVLFGR